MIASSPLWLALALPAAATLWWVYRSGDVSRERILGSTMLLERAKLVSRSVKWRPPWRALVEALLLLVIITALVDFRSGAPGERVIVAVDNGPRMAAVVAPNSTEIRLSAAKRRAVAEIASLPFDARVIVTTLGSVSKPLTPAEAQKEVNRIGLTYQTADIVEAAAKARAAAGMSRAIIISEGDFALPKPDWVSWIPIGEELVPNIALAGFDAASGALTIASFSDAESNFVLNVTDSAGASVALRKGTVGPSARRVVSLGDIKNFPDAGSVNLKASADGLVIDNFLYFSKDSTPQAIQVSSPLPLSRLGLEPLTQFSFADFVRGADTGERRAALLHRPSTVAPTCSGRRVIIEPVNDSQLSNASSERVSWWSQEDELLRYVNPSRLLVSMVAGGALQRGKPLVTTPAGAVMTRELDGECETIRLSFELLPFDPKADRTVGILTLNLLSWLADLSGSESARLRVPVGEQAQRLLPAAGDPVIESIVSEPGLYEVKPVQGSTDKRNLRAVSFLSPVVSDLRKRTVHRTPAVDVAGKQQAATGSDGASITVWLLLGALALCLLDLSVFGTRRRRGSAVDAEQRSKEPRMGVSV